MNKNTMIEVYVELVNVVQEFGVRMIKRNTIKTLTTIKPTDIIRSICDEIDNEVLTDNKESEESNGN